MHSHPLRILHCNFLNEKRVGIYYYSNNRRISSGFIKNGHFVYEFSYREMARSESWLGLKKFGIKRMNDKLLEAAENIQPHILLLGHAELIHSETLIEFKKRFPNSKIVMWWVDMWHMFYRDKKIFEQRMEHLDCLFTTSDPDFVKEKYEPARRAGKVCFMPNSADASVDIGRAFERSDYLHDAIFVGRSTSDRSDVVSFLKSEFKDINLGLYGQNSNNMLLAHKYIEVISATRMGINYSRHIDMPLYSSNRMIQLAANGCLVITPRTPKMEELFSNTEVVYFDGLNDMADKIKFYIEHPEDGRKIAIAGHAKAHQTFNNKDVMAKMIDNIYLR